MAVRSVIQGRAGVIVGPLVLCAVLGFTAVASAGLTDTDYQDAVGDASDGRAPDIGRVAVSNDAAGNVALRVSYANRSCVGAGDFVAVFLDVDRNPATPDDRGTAAEYALFVDGMEQTRGIAKFDGARYQPASLPSLTSFCEAGADVWTLNRGDVGVTDGFDFWLRANSTDSSGQTFSDFAPGSPRVWTYWWVTPGPPEPTPPAVDRRAPTVRALRVTYHPGARALLRARLWDDSGRARVVEQILDGRGRVLGAVRGPFVDRADGRIVTVSWRVPRGYDGTLRHCATAWDRAGNRSARSCAALIRR